MSPYFLFGPHLNIGKNTSNVTDCPNGVHWIWVMLSDCVNSPQEHVSAYLGIASLITWMLVGLPQMIKNFRNIEGLAGVSFLLLIQWTAGDITNLIGAILTSQLKLQSVMSSFITAAADSTPRLILCLMGLVLISHGMCYQKVSTKEALILTEKYHTFKGHISRSLLHVRSERSGSFLYESEQGSRLKIDGGFRKDIFEDEEFVFWHDKVTILGYIIGIMSSVFYLGFRLAQIYKNKRSQSTQGLAILTFVLAVIGNLTYGAQILVRDVSTEFLLEKTPWLVGSLGVVGLDCVLLFQFHYYHRKHSDIPEMSRALLDKEYIINAEDEETNDFIY